MNSDMGMADEKYFYHLFLTPCISWIIMVFLDFWAFQGFQDFSGSFGFWAYLGLSLHILALKSSKLKICTTRLFQALLTFFISLLASS